MKGKVSGGQKNANYCYILVIAPARFLLKGAQSLSMVLGRRGSVWKWFNTITPNISFVILLIICWTILIELGIGSVNNPLINSFFFHILKIFLRDIVFKFLGLGIKCCKTCQPKRPFG